MEDWASGFRIDEAFYPWGTLFDAAAPGRVESGYASVKLPCRSAYGFATVYAEPAAPRPDRPVTTVTYELADTGTAPRYLFAELVKRLGQPDEVSRDDSPEHANENTVVLHANWHRDKVEDRPVALRRADGRPISAMRSATSISPGPSAMPPLQPFLADWIAANRPRLRRRQRAQGSGSSRCGMRSTRTIPTARARRAGAAVAGPAAHAAGDRRAPRQDDFRPVDRRRRFALVPLDRPHHRAAGG